MIDPEIDRAVDRASASRRPRGARVLLVALGAFALYGGWAAWVNWPHGPALAVRAGVLQGAMSFAITALMASALEAIFAAVSRRWRLWVMISTPLVGTLSVLVGAHALAGTPEILWTVLPSATIGTLFAIGYARALTRAERRERRDASTPAVE